MRSAPNFPCLILLLLICGFCHAKTIGDNNSTFEYLGYEYLKSNKYFSKILSNKINPEIIQQPIDQNICTGESASFSIVTNGSGLKYEWWINNGGSSYKLNDNKNYSGTNTSKLIISNPAAWMDNHQFWVVVTNISSEQIISNKAILKVNKAPAIWTQPVNSTICTGGATSFIIYSSGTSFQWQVSTNGGNSWTNLNNDFHYSNVRTNQLQISNAVESMKNSLYRIKSSNGNCSVYSLAAEININPAPQITANPENTTVISNNNAIFHATVIGNDLNFQWQTFNGSWYNVNDGGTYSGTTTNQLTVHDTKNWQNNYRFRLLVTNSAECMSISKDATLTVSPEGLTIGIPRINKTSACTGSILGISFDLIDETWLEDFSASSVYNIFLGKLDQDEKDYVLITSFQSDIVPQSFSMATIERTFKIPYNLSTGDYQIFIQSENPSVKSPSVTFTVEVKGTWIGATNINWNTASNWGCDFIPTSTTNVIIPAGTAHDPVLNTDTIGTAKNIKIEPGASLEISDNELQIGGTIINNGNFNAINGTVSLKGTSAQTIPENTFLKNRIRNLTIDNPKGVNLQGTLAITSILNAKTGNLNIQDSLTLISTEAQTALIDGSGTGEIVGTVTMQRYLGNSFGYKYFSSPFQDSFVGDFQDFVDLNADFPNFYRYNNNRQDNQNRDATGWENYTTLSSPLNVMQGYALNFGAEKIPKTVEITGKVNNGAQQISLYNNNGKYTKGFNLVGNPYPSPIDWNATTGWNKINIDDAIYFFTAGNSNRYTGTYTSYVNGISSSDGKSSNIIPSMQGFFVHVSDSPTNSYPVQGTLGMTNEVRINDFSQEFLKSPEPEKHPLIRITAGFENENKVDPLVIYFNSYSSPGFEKNLDAHKLMNTAVNVPNFYSFTPKKDKLAINAIPDPIYKELNRIPLGLKTEKAGTISIRLKNVENISSGAHLYLIDQEKRIAQDLNSNPEYKFLAKKGQIDSRFYLMFSNTRITDPAIAFDEPFSVETGNSRVLVKMNLEQGESGSLRVSSVSGRTLEILKVAGKESVEIQGIKSTGVYFISLLSGKEKFTRKVLFKK